MAGLYPIILCGGSGSRLWPSSRRESPKQFQPIGGGQTTSFLQATLQRHTASGIEPPMLVTNRRYAPLVHQQLQEIQCSGELLCEPIGRNTGPAVLAASLRIAERDPDAVVVVLPSDHAIKGDMNRLFFDMRRAADEGRIVIFGIPPIYPETGYGYITDGGQFLNYPGLHRVDRFVEKPPLEHATALIATGAAYWASGISMFRAETIIEEFRKIDPDTLRAVETALHHGQMVREGWLMNEASFAEATSAPTEQTIFERSSAVALAPAHVQWNDVGSWSAVYDIGAADQNGNVTDGDVVAVDTRNSLIRAQDRLVTVIGMSDLIVVDTPDALLVAPKSQTQQVKAVVGALEAGNRPEVMRHRKQMFSWGGKRKLTEGRDVEVDVLDVKPGAQLSLMTTDRSVAVMPISGEFGISRGGASDPLTLGRHHGLDSGTQYFVSNFSDDFGRLMVFNTTRLPQQAAHLDKAQHA